MAHLWSGRFAAIPTRRCSSSAPRSASTAVCSRTTSRAAWRGPRRSQRAGVLTPRTRRRFATALHEILARGGPTRRSSTSDAPRTKTCTRSSSASSSTRVGDAGTRLHTGRSRNEQVVGRPPAVPEAPRPGAAARHRARSSRRSPTGATRRRRADAGLHAPAARAAGARRALLPGARGGAAPRPRPLRRGARAKPTSCRSARARSPAPATRSTSQALADALGFSRVVANSIDAIGDRDFVVVVPARVRAGDGAPQPAGRGPDPLHVARSSGSSSWPTPRRPAAA